MEYKLSSELCQYLKDCGMPEREIEKCSGLTRLYHDLGFYGDVAETYMEVLAEKYHVDFSGFDFDKYFPSEFQGNSFLSRVLLWFLPFASYVVRQRREYLPLTLEKIDHVIKCKKWT